jgi:LCP family protein required for cell wall assembly
VSSDDHPPSNDDVWDRLAALPSLGDDPLDAPWLPGSPDAGRTRDPVPVVGAEPTPDPGYDQRRIRVGAERAEHDRPPPGQSPAGHPEPAHPPEIEHAPVHRRRAAAPRRRFGRVVAVLLLLAGLIGGGFFITAWVMWGRVETVDTQGALTPTDTAFTNYLIVGTDSRAGLSDDLETADNIGLGIDGERSDTMLVLHVANDGNRMVSLPRDLRVNIDGGGTGKLNGALARGGVPSLIRTIRSDPGIPVHHYLEVDIAGFLDVVEAVGSIQIAFRSPACDPKSGLDIRATGLVSLDPEQALAYVRSRTYTEFDADAAVGLSCRQIRSSGLGTTVGNSDFGRTERQRAFLLAVFDRVSSTRNPVTLLRVLNDLTGGLRVDEHMGMFDAFSLLRDLRGLNAAAMALPVSDQGADLILNSESAAVLELFSASPGED